MSATTVTAIEALRRLVAEVKLLDASEVGERWNQLGGVLGVAEGVLRDGEEGDAIGTLLRGDDSILFEPLYDFHVTDGMKVYAAPTAAEKNKMYRRRMDALPIAAPTAVVAVPEDERAAFEADTLDVFPVATFGRFASGRYNIDWIENQWEGWQRRAKFAAPQPAAAPSGDVERKDATSVMPRPCNHCHGGKVKSGLTMMEQPCHICSGSGVIWPNSGIVAAITATKE